MRILITNDDGIDAMGIQVLHDIACQLTAAENITTVAPAYEQSGVGHCITYTSHLDYEQVSPNRFALNGSPADCVIVGAFDILGGDLPDLVLSGVNRGNNAAQNTLYSGTVGATIEAAMHNIPSIALSQFYGPDLDGLDIFDAARAYGVETIQRILDANIWDAERGCLFYNVNFPPTTAQNVKGFRITSQGFRTGSPFVTERRDDKLWIAGRAQHDPTAKGSDVHANLDGYVAITPCHIDLTSHSHIGELNKRFS